MSAQEDFLGVPPFAISRPARQTSAVVYNSPHSGRYYPLRFLAMTRLDEHAIRRSEDCHVDLLFAHVTECGSPLMAANFPRAYLDANREAFELDPRMFNERLPAHANTRSVRVAGGLGTIPRVVAEGHQIYAGRMALSEAVSRIDHVYRPYHTALGDLLSATRDRFGHALLIDCHSMPGSVRVPEFSCAPDFIIGDRFGAAASFAVVDHAVSVLRGLGHTVAHNKPYAGGFITEHYGRPASRMHAIQLEINRALYMDERTYETHAGFEALRKTLKQFATAMADLPVEWMAGGSLAAE